MSQAEPPLSHHLAETIRAYDGAPDDYAERFRQSDISPLRDQFIAGLGPDCGLVIDAGCGTGRDLAEFAAAGLDVVGIDLSVGLLEEASKHIAQEGQKAGLMHCDFRCLPFDDGAISAVWAMASLVHLDRGEFVEALAEFRRVLSDDGVAFISVKQGGTKSGSVEVWEPGPGGAERWFRYYLEDEVLEMAEEAGLTVAFIDGGEGCSHGTWVNAVLERAA